MEADAALGTERRILGDSVQVIPALDTVALGNPCRKARDEHGDADDQRRVRVQHRLKNPKVDAAVCPDIEPPMEVRNQGQARGAEHHVHERHPRAAALCAGVPHDDGVSGKENHAANGSVGCSSEKRIRLSDHEYPRATRGIMITARL